MAPGVVLDTITIGKGVVVLEEDDDSTDVVGGKVGISARDRRKQVEAEQMRRVA